MPRFHPKRITANYTSIVHVNPPFIADYLIQKREKKFWWIQQSKVWSEAGFLLSMFAALPEGEKNFTNTLSNICGYGNVSLSQNKYSPFMCFDNQLCHIRENTDKAKPRIYQVIFYK